MVKQIMTRYIGSHKSYIIIELVMWTSITTWLQILEEYFGSGNSVCQRVTKAHWENVWKNSIFIAHSITGINITNFGKGGLFWPKGY